MRTYVCSAEKSQVVTCRRRDAQETLECAKTLFIRDVVDGDPGVSMVVTGDAVFEWNRLNRSNGVAFHGVVATEPIFADPTVLDPLPTTISGLLSGHHLCIILIIDVGRSWLLLWRRRC